MVSYIVTSTQKSTMPTGMYAFCTVVVSAMDYGQQGPPNAPGNRDGASHQLRLVLHCLRALVHELTDHIRERFIHLATHVETRHLEPLPVACVWWTAQSHMPLEVGFFILQLYSLAMCSQEVLH